MKRGISLVSYASSDENSDEESLENDFRRKDHEPVKRKLPRVSRSLVLSVPKSDPALHQGRVRTAPHVDGQFAAFVYTAVPMHENPKLQKVLERAICAAREIVPHLNSDWLENKESELHISLTRPIYLRDHQREELKRAVKAVARGNESFFASFSTFAAFDNDERTRAFLGCEVGAGHSEFKSLSDALVPALQILHQKTFYSEPRFHASIAWTLPAQHLQVEGSSSEKQSWDATASPYLSTTLPKLNKNLGQELSKEGTGVFEVVTIQVKIGKDVHGWNLGAS